MKTTFNRRNWLKSSLLVAPMAIGALAMPKLRASENTFLLEGESELDLGRKIIKLNANENPYGPSPLAKDAIIASMTKGNLYPRQFVKKLKKAIAEQENLSEDHILLTAGSTELLGLCGMYYGLKSGKIVSEFPTFPTLPTYSKLFKAKWVQVPLNEQMQLDLPAMAKKITPDTNLLYLCNPNNPVGTSVSRQSMLDFCRETTRKVPVFVDEAYIDFIKGGLKNSVAPLVQANKKLIVARTFSKIHGLAGLRIGFALAHPETIKELQKYLMSRSGMSVSACSLNAAHASMQDKDFLDYTLRQTNRAKEMLYAKLDQWGATYAKSSTSFVLFNLPVFGTLNFRGEMEKKNVLIRSFKFSDKNWCRVSIGRIEEIKTFMREMDTIV